MKFVPTHKNMNISALLGTIDIKNEITCYIHVKYFEQSPTTIDHDRNVCNLVLKVCKRCTYVFAFMSIFIFIFVEIYDV
jgi:hypothetical protein